MFVNTDESLASFLGVWEPGIRWKTSKIWRSQKSQTLCTLGWIRGGYFVWQTPLEQHVSSPCRSRFWSFLHCMDSHEESQDLGIAQQCADSCNMDWKSIDACLTGDLGHKWDMLQHPFNWLIIDVLPAYRLGQSYPLLYYGWSMPIVSQCCVMSDAHTKGLVVSESDPHTGRLTIIKRLRLYSPLLYSCFTPKLEA